mmetsp:Transcript_45253/g.114580  ORF Transcript_45253/g.114580 Transcript_45253/m.114580 type:complete len:546 (+) Transcript_45253:52-1689(+)
MLESHEKEAIKQMEGRRVESEQAQSALAELLEASQRLQRDSDRLVEENQGLRREIESLKAASDTKHVTLDDSEDALLPPKRLSDGETATLAVHVSAASAWLAPLLSASDPVSKRTSAMPKPPREVDPRTPGTRSRMLQQVAAALKGGGNFREEDAAAQAAALQQATKTLAAQAEQEAMKSPRQLGAADLGTDARRRSPDDISKSATSLPTSPPSLEGAARPPRPGAGRRSADDSALGQARLPGGDSRAHQRGAHQPEAFRAMSLRQTKDFIADVCASKRKADARANSSGAPRETMHQHLVTFLAHRFGLKKLSAEWHQGLQAAMATFESADAHVKLFRKVLRNEIEEEFIPTLHEHEQLIHAELAKCLASKFDLKERSSRLQRAVARRRQGVVPQDEWRSILSQILRPREAASVAADICQLPRAAGQPEGLSSSEEEEDAGWGNGHCVEYRQVVQTLLYRHLKTHQRALAPVLDAFRKVDVERRGVLSADQFSQFCLCINPSISMREVGVLLSAMDPHKHRRVTFSSCAHILASELERMVQNLRQ